MINDSVTTFLPRFRLGYTFLILLIMLVSSSCSMRSTTIQTEIVVHNAENIVIPESDMINEEEDPEITAEYPERVEVSNPELEVTNPEVTNSELEVSNPELGVSNPELLEVSNPELLEVTNPELEVSTPELLKISTPEPFIEKEPEASADARRFYSRYSKKLGIHLDGTENKALIKSIARWLRVPFKWGGCSKRGVDCSCFVKLVYKDVYGISLNRTSRNIVYKNLDTIKKRELQEGDIISFKIDGDKISHIGIYLKNNKFVHVSRSKGVRISNLNGKYYRERFFSAGRVKRGLRKVYMAQKTSRPKPAKSEQAVKLKLNELVVFESIDSNNITVSSM